MSVYAVYTFLKFECYFVEQSRISCSRKARLPNQFVESISVVIRLPDFYCTHERVCIEVVASYCGKLVDSRSNDALFDQYMYCKIIKLYSSTQL